MFPLSYETLFLWKFNFFIYFFIKKLNTNKIQNSTN